jgi:hypothetical protein
MNNIRFELRPTSACPPDLGVGIWIDGQSLIDTIRMSEAPWWSARGLPQPENQYAWVPARSALLPGRHLLGEPVVPGCDGFSAVLVCNCGEPACRSIAVRVEVAPGRLAWVGWREFPMEETRLAGMLRRLVFDRDQYLGALERISEEYRLTKRCSGPAWWRAADLGR